MKKIRCDNNLELCRDYPDCKHGGHWVWEENKNINYEKVDVEKEIENFHKELNKKCRG